MVPDAHIAAGEAKKCTVAATSSGVPTLPNGLSARRRSPSGPASLAA